MKTKFVVFLLIIFVSNQVFCQIFEKQGANVTIITHGWNPSGGQPGWMQPMAEAIIERSGGKGHIANITVTGTLGNLTATCTNWNFNFADSDYCQIVVLVNWTAVANHLNTRIPSQDVAAVVAPKIYQSQNGKPALSELPIHLIGHSRGGGLIFQIAKLLGEQGIEVDQVTPLDPHPLTSADPQSVPNTIDASINPYENIQFIDCYWQNITFPKGQYINGAYNRLWTSLPGGYHNETGYTYNILGTNYDFSDHLNTILAYHGTIDSVTPVYNGEATMNSTERNWFNDFENNGENTGFKYSQIVYGVRLSDEIPVEGGDQIMAGLHNNALIGGTGTRTALNWTNAQWANILKSSITLGFDEFLPGNNTIPLNKQVYFNFVYRSYANQANISFIFDVDRNPYNNNDVLTAVSNTFSATGSDMVQEQLSWIVQNLVIGNKYYVYAKIFDGTRTRYFYLPYELTADLAPGFSTSILNKFNIYPNPTSRFVNISAANIEKISVIDINGKVISVFIGSQIIDISNFCNGIYFLKIETQKDIFVEKIIKK